MTESSVVVLHDLRVAFGGGKLVALDGITVSLRGGIVGLVGANGAGKTTLLRCVAGAQTPSSGSVSIGGTEARRYRQQMPLGFIPAQARFPAYLSVAQFLSGLRQACGNPAITDGERDLASAFDLERLGDRRLNTLSLGQSRRVEVVAALIGDPDLVLFDEPTNGLDPIAMTQLRQGILAAERPGRCIIVSSHHLDELQRLASRVLFLKDGRLVGDHSAADLAAAGQSLEARFLSTEGTPNA
jgi:ABC-2 type transport system ATP-binding protein